MELGGKHESAVTVRVLFKKEAKNLVVTLQPLSWNSSTDGPTDTNFFFFLSRIHTQHGAQTHLNSQDQELS